MTLYQQLKDAGVPLDHHESDLYAQVTPESTKIIEAHSCHASTFRDIKGYPWYDLVGMYQPFWDAREAATDANSPQAQA